MLDTCFYVDDVISGADDTIQAFKITKAFKQRRAFMQKKTLHNKILRSGKETFKSGSPNLTLVTSNRRLICLNNGKDLKLLSKLKDELFRVMKGERTTVSETTHIVVRLLKDAVPLHGAF
ncbi:hypothetical protein TNCT_546861 [Trichonephila clavata]|uniref:Uncharacterized protein n=1 Tax=Trichonephila clavata TaxID=2740835 RepID=A0A8X6H297_TRICU|nr:hypothetical protein TNCT_546861 [Trichonephila clavata]